MNEQTISPVKVSVVTTVYNAATTIEDTILSVLGQTYPHIEYIVVDGGSTDGTLQIINKYRDSITHLISERDEGIADGFNKGISLATGTWVGMINADDWYAPDAIENMLRTVNPANDVYCGNIMLVGASSTRMKRSKVNWLSFGMFIMHPTCFIRREVYSNVGKYDSGLKIAMDFDMMLRIRKAGYNISYADKLVAYMRVGGVSANVNHMHKEELTVMRRHLRGPRFVLSGLYKELDKIRWKYFSNNLIVK